MKRKLAVLFALVACVGLVAVPVANAKKKTKRVETTVSLSFTDGSAPYSPYLEDTFTGRVEAKKGCKKNRTIVIKERTSPALDLIRVLGSTTSTKNGNYAFSASTSPGTYTATAKKRTRRNQNGNKIVCQRGSSEPVVVAF